MLEKEEQTETFLTVAPHQRRHIIGPGGASLRKLYKEFRGVRVTIPPFHDHASHSVCVEGSRSQVPDAVAFIRTLLQKAEAEKVKAKTTRRQAEPRRGAFPKL